MGLREVKVQHMTHPRPRRVGEKDKAQLHIVQADVASWGMKEGSDSGKERLWGNALGGGKAQHFLGGFSSEITRS